MFGIFIPSRLIEIRSGHIIKMNTLPKRPPRSSHRFPTRNYLITTLNFVKPVLIAIPVLEHTQMHTIVPGRSSGLSTLLLAHYIDMRSVRAQNKSTLPIYINLTLPPTPTIPPHFYWFDRHGRTDERRVHGPWSHGRRHRTLFQFKDACGQPQMSWQIHRKLVQFASPAVVLAAREACHDLLYSKFHQFKHVCYTLNRGRREFERVFMCFYNSCEFCTMINRNARFLSLLLHELANCKHLKTKSKFSNNLLVFSII